MRTAIYLAILITIAACTNTKKETDSAQEETISKLTDKYIYIDRDNNVHTYHCFFLSFALQHEHAMYISFRDTSSFCADSSMYYCSNCVDVNTYEWMQKLSKRNNNVSALYRALLKNGYSTEDIGCEDVFRANMQDSEKRDELYNYVAARGDFNIGSKESYDRRIGGRQ